MNQRVLTFCCSMLAGTGLCFVPAGVASSIRGIITDVLRPGQQTVRRMVDQVQDRFVSAKPAKPVEDDELARLTEELETERDRNQILQIQLASIAERDTTDREIPPSMMRSIRSKRLIIPDLVEVAVMGDLVAEQWRSGRLLAHGAKQGLRENELVLASRKTNRPIIDFGEDASLSTEDPILLGHCVIGKIEHVGQWSSTVQLVTDSRYRGRAQVIHETDTGFVFEAQGILKGRGEPLCRLDGIPATKSVRVNDAVYTADRDGILPTPLYYGRVVEATLGPDDREWTVFVRPAPLPSHLTTVKILRTAINPDRLVVK